MTVNRNTPQRLTLMLACAAVVGSLIVGNTAAYAQVDTLARIQQAKKIRIAMDPNLPPWSYKNDKLEMTGSEYETAQLLAHDLGVELEMVPTNGASRIPLLLTDKADLVVAAMTITPERQKVIDFSNPYSGTTSVVAAPKGLVIKSVTDLVGKRVAVARGTVMDTDLTAMAPKGTEIVRFEDEATTMTSVLSGQVDIVAESVTLNEAINKRDPSKQLETKLVLRNSLHGMGMRKGDKRLKDWIDQWIKTNMANGKLVAVFKKHQAIDLPGAVVQAAQAAQ
jgi:polar amino acid transport system substrate-binding protein